jgi:hydroxysqualene dehydroxylase
MLVDGPAAPAQWLFGRGVQRREGRALTLAGAVVSTHDAGTPLAALADAVSHQVVAQLGCPAPLHARAVVDKRATFRCTPGRPKLGPGSLVDLAGPAFEGIVLAGDYAYADYPSTLESAVRSGLAAARWIDTGR